MFAWILLSAAQAQNVLDVPDVYGTLAIAVEAADPGDIIEVDGSTDYARIVDNDVLITKNLTIRGVGSRPDLPRVNIVGADVTMEFVRLRGVNRSFVNLGVDVGGVLTSGSLILDDVTLAAGNGSAIGVAAIGGELILRNVTGNYFYEQPAVRTLGGYLEIDNSTFSNNFAGAVHTQETDLYVFDSEFTFNWADGAAADLHVDNLLSGNTVTVEDTLFDFSTGHTGGSISVDKADLVLNRCQFYDPWSTGSGGAIHVIGTGDNPAYVWVAETEIERGYASEQGGALYLENIAVDSEIVDSTLTLPFSDGGGGGVVLVNGELTVKNTTIDRGSSVWGNAGAIWARTGDVGPAASPTALYLVDSDINGFQNGTTGGLAAGCVWAETGTNLTVDGGSFENCAATFNGGAIAFQGQVLSIDGTTFKDNDAVWGAGIWQTAGVLSVANANFTGNQASFGAAIMADALQAQIADSWFTGNIADSASVVELTNASSFVLQRNRFCANTAVQSGAITYVTGTGNLEGQFLATNNVWLENATDLGAALFYAPSNWLSNVGPPIAIRNNDFLLDSVSTAISARGEVEFTNNIVGGQAIGFLLEEHFGNVLSGTHNLWYLNALNAQGTQGVLPDATDLQEADPLFQGLVEGDCASNLWLQAESPARDAGNPGILDPDGSISDIGAFGGPAADLIDQDGDGVYEDLDCNDADPAVHPGIPEIPYDGVDNDCDGTDLCDGDGDGFTAVECGGEDCDDTNAEIHPLARDIPDDGFDNNCDGFEPSTWVGGASCACDGTSGGGLPALVWVWLVGLGAIRRR